MPRPLNIRRVPAVYDRGRSGRLPFLAAGLVLMGLATAPNYLRGQEAPATDAATRAPMDTEAAGPAAVGGTDSDSHSGSANHRALALMSSITIFVLAIFVGFEVITKVSPTLHTPLMSGSNAISGITVVGAILAAGADGSWWSVSLGFVATVLAMINVVGGYAVTDRMLAMFRKP